MLFSAVRVFDGTRFLGGVYDVAVEGSAVSAVVEVQGPRPDAHGGALFPGFVDAHVHVAFSSAAEIVAGGVTSALDLGMPLDDVSADHRPLRLGVAGPLLTAPRGYPTRSWGANGFGLEVAGPSDAADAVSMLADRGVSIVKVAIEPSEGPVPDAETLSSIARAARERGLRSAAHALGVTSVRMAIRAGMDVLAHTPTEALPDDVVLELGARGVVVISTLRAFGAGRSAVRNVAALADAGCPIAYGTDLGNGAIAPGIDTEELGLLAGALGGVEPALRAATSVGAELLGSGGVIAPGKAADFVWVPGFQILDDLRGEKRTWIGGAEMRRDALN